jgi:hypothetical protein
MSGADEVLELLERGVLRHGQLELRQAGVRKYVARVLLPARSSGAPPTIVARQGETVTAAVRALIDAIEETEASPSATRLERGRP